MSHVCDGYTLGNLKIDIRTEHFPSLRVTDTIYFEREHRKEHLGPVVIPSMTIVQEVVSARGNSAMAD